MPGQAFGDRKPYLSIVQGKLRQKVTEDTPNAEKREYELKDGKKGVKYELIFKSWLGRIVDLRIKDGDFGEMLEVEFDDAVLSINTESRYFSNLVGKLAAVDINEQLQISPYDFEPDGKRSIGITVRQIVEGNDIKIENYFYDSKKKKWINGMPVPEGDTSKFKKDDWKVFYLGVKKFLISEVEKIKEKIVLPESHEVTQEDIDSVDPEITQEAPQENINGEDEEEVKIEDVPF